MFCAHEIKPKERDLHNDYKKDKYKMIIAFYQTVGLFEFPNTFLQNYFPSQLTFLSQTEYAINYQMCVCVCVCA